MWNIKNLSWLKNEAIKHQAMGFAMSYLDKIFENTKWG